MSKTLILFTDNQSYYFDRIHAPDLTIRGLFYDHAELKNPVLKFLRKIKSPLTRLFYQDWYRHLADYEKIIVLDTAFLFDEKLRHIHGTAPEKCFSSGMLPCAEIQTDHISTKAGAEIIQRKCRIMP